MRTIGLLLLGIAFWVPCGAQTHFFVGYGKYESAHLGASFRIKKQRSFQVFAGVQPYSNPSSFSSNFGLSYRREFESKVHVQLKSILWYYNSSYFRFINTANGIELGYTCDSKKKPYGITVNAGGVYNSVLKYDRKTWEEIAWPKDWQPSFSVALIYRLKSNE